MDLKSLGLTPSATLVLTPSSVSQYSAYPNLGGGIPSPWGLVSAVRSGVTSAVGLGYNTVTGLVGAVTGGSSDNNVATPQPPPEPSRQLQAARPSRGSGGVRIRTLQDMSTDRHGSANAGTRFYNGNQVSVSLLTMTGLVSANWWILADSTLEYCS